MAYVPLHLEIGDGTCVDTLQIKLTIYDLVTGVAHVIQYPKSHINCESETYIRLQIHY